jgi:hypothetical protein
MQSSTCKKPGISAIRSACMNENGAVLIVSLVFMVLLAMLGITAVVMTTTDMKIGANYRDKEQAFCDAEAGVKYGLGKMEAELKASSSTFSLPTIVGNSFDLDADATFTTPTGFRFSFKDPGLTMLAANLYIFTTDGTAGSNSSATITVTCRQKPAITMAAFGDEKLDIKNSAVITSYKSSSSDPSVSNPLTARTHEADIGSNEWLLTGSADIDGNGVLGEDLSGVDATNAISDPNDFYGNETPVDEENIDPDPLDVCCGGEFDPTTYANPADNDNGLATGLVGNTIALNTPATLYDTLAGGTANYYLTSIIVANGDTLTIDTSRGGDVRVFLTGGIDLKNGSDILMIPASYDATKFAIFSNSTDNISIKNSADFTGLLYAPYSTNVDVMNGADFYGTVWGANVELKNSGNVRYDSALADAFTTKDMEILSWLDVRN